MKYRSLLICLALLASRIDAFSVIRCVQSSFRVSVSLRSFLNDEKDETSDGVPANFNPFDYKASRSVSSIGYSGTQISLRKSTMDQLVNELLNVVGNEQQTTEVLENYKDFLLEPLEDDDAVLDPDSIYDSTMDRTARYVAYRESMEARLSSARNPSVKRVLDSMKQFVLSHE